MEEVHCLSLLGSTNDSWGFRVDGKRVHEGKVIAYAPHFTNLSPHEGKVSFRVQVYVDCESGVLSFSDNGVDWGQAFVIPQKNFGFFSSSLYAAVCFASSAHTATFID